MLKDDNYYQLNEYERNRLIDYTLGLVSLFYIPIDFIEEPIVNLTIDNSILELKTFPELLNYYGKKDKENNLLLTKIASFVDEILQVIDDEKGANYSCTDYRLSAHYVRKYPIDTGFRKGYRLLSTSAKICRIVDHLYNNDNATYYNREENIYITSREELSTQLSNLDINTLIKSDSAKKEVESLYQKLYLDIFNAGYLRRSLYAYPPKQLIIDYMESRQIHELENNNDWHLDFLNFIKNRK